MLIIKKKRIRLLESNVPLAFKSKLLTLAVPVDKHSKQLVKLGFGESAKVGDAILPSAIGPATRFNAYGKVLIAKDKPKETVTHSMEWTREQWAGRGKTETVTSTIYRSYERYARVHVPGPGLTLVISGGKESNFVTLSSPINYSEENSTVLVAALNLFLEAFSEVVIYETSTEELELPSSLTQLNWRILPPGERLTRSELAEALKKALSRSKGVRAAEITRQEMLSGYKPDVIAVGQGGFSGYVAYVFQKKNIALLESIKYGNATYVLSSKGWEPLSKLTKGELVSQKVVKQRIIHTARWEDQIKKIV